MPETKSKRKPKFGHLKVGDEVVIHHIGSVRHSIGRVTEVGPRSFRAGWKEWGAYHESYFWRGTGEESTRLTRTKQVIAVDANQLEVFRDEYDLREIRVELDQFVRREKHNNLTLPQLRRIRAELDAVTTEPRT